MIEQLLPFYVFCTYANPSLGPTYTFIVLPTMISAIV